MNLLRLRVVLAAIELDEAAVTTLRTAIALAAAAGARLDIVHVTHGAQSAETNARTERAVHAILGRAGAEAHNTPLHVLSGEPANSIRMLADKLGADVIVLGPHRTRADAGGGLGSTALAIVTTSWAPCLVVARTMRLPIERVLVPLDRSDTARGALIVALSWASALRAQERAGDVGVHLMAVHADQSAASGEGRSEIVRQMEADLAPVRADAGSWAGVAIDPPAVVQGEPTAAIADYAIRHSVDLVVLGTRGLGLDSVGRLGSVSGEVARRLDIPTLLVPPAVWQAHAKA
jgi:nucleotide-binding universal stress UspA family protein